MRKCWSLLLGRTLPTMLQRHRVAVDGGEVVGVADVVDDVVEGGDRAMGRIGWRLTDCFALFLRFLGVSYALLLLAFPFHF